MFSLRSYRIYHLGKENGLNAKFDKNSYLKLNDMTNEEKVKEIANKRNIFGRYIMDEIEKSCLEIAQWKDEQFLKFLLWLDDFYVIKKFDDGEPMTYGELVEAFENQVWKGVER